MKLKILASVGLLTGFFFSCKKEQPLEVNANGTTYYIHPTDNSKAYAWADEFVVTGAGSLTDGQQNTVAINAQTGTYAAKICSQLNAFGHDDWYLPSKDELVAIALYLDDKSSFVNDGLYWSSSETGPNTVWTVHFPSGNTSTRMKDGLLPCRCIRK